MTDKLEGDKYITLHMVWPISVEIHGMLAENDFESEPEFDGEVISNMKKLGRKYLVDNKEDFAPSFYHKAITVLTPSMKKLKKIGEIERSEVYQSIERYIHGSNTANDNLDVDEDGLSSPVNNHIPNESQVGGKFVTC